MICLSKEVIYKSRFCGKSFSHKASSAIERPLFFFQLYIFDTNRLSLWSVFWYLMYSFMDLIYTRKVNLDQVWIVIFIKHFVQICILYMYLWCNIKYSTNAPDVEICLFMLGIMFLLYLLVKRSASCISSACFNVALVTEPIPDQTVLIDI